MAKRSGSVPSGLHVVVTGDIVASRRVEDRAALQARLQKLLAGLNRRHSEVIEVPFAVSGGDEFQGVLAAGAPVFALADEVARELYPVRVRLGVGIGSIATRLAARSQEMDGEAFAFSRSAVDDARANNVWLWFRSRRAGFDATVNLIARLLWAIKRRWTPVYWRRAALRDQCWTEERIARFEHVSQAAVSACLRRADYPAVEKARQGLARLWQETWHNR